MSSHQLSVSLQKDKCDITLTAQNRGTDTSRDLQAQLDVKSTMRKTSLRSLSVAAAHKDNGQQLTNNVDVKLNGKVYSYGANMDMGPGSNTGDLTLTWPRQQVRLYSVQVQMQRLLLRCKLLIGWYVKDIDVFY